MATSTYSVNIRGYWTAGIYLCHNFLVPMSSAELRQADNWVVLDSIALPSPRVTIHTHVDIRTLHVLGLVLLTGYVRNAILIYPSISSIRISTVTGPCMPAVNESLDRGNNISSSSLILKLY